jgi:3-oxoacyl-[acyl-carrier-protein] synthase II
MNKNKKRRVVVTGIGVVCSAGIGKEQFWKNCLKANANVQHIPEQWHYYHPFRSQIWTTLPEIDFTKEGIDRFEQMQMDKNQVLALIAARQAIEDADINYHLKDKKKKIYEFDHNLSDNFGVYVGTGNGGLASYTASVNHHLMLPLINDLKSIAEKLRHSTLMLDQWIETINMTRQFNRFLVAATMPNASSAKIGIKYSLTGPNNTCCIACASGTSAIGNAYRAIKNGDIDKAVAGGVEFFGDDFGSVFRAFDVAKTLVSDCHEPETANRPFDEKRSGFLFSEGGAAMFVIEELEHALKRHTEIYAEITGFSETCDAFNIMMIEPSAIAIKKMIFDLLNQGNNKPEEIDYINAHGTGTITNDAIEAQVIEEIFGKDVLVNSTKSIVGHTIGASGAIEASATILSIKNKTTHICKNLKIPIADLNFVRQVEDHDIDTAISQSFGFGGHNSALSFKGFEK